MNFKSKKSVFFALFFASIILFSCKKRENTYYKNQNEVNIPIASIDMTKLVDVNSVPKLDVNSLLPAPIKKGVEHQIVTGIQSRLMELGFMEEDKATSFYGDSTADAIKKLEVYGRWTYVVKFKGTDETALMTSAKYDEIKQRFS